MSESDSFLDEVTEEVRRDRLLAFLRKNALWIAGVLVVLIGGIAANEIWKSRTETAAQATGDAMLAALTTDDAAARTAALETLLPDAGAAAPLVRLQLAALQARDDPAAAIAALESVVTDRATDTAVADVARLKIVMLGAGETAISERRAILDRLMVEGHPLRTLALEQLALIEIESGDTDAALATLAMLVAAPDASAAARERAADLTVALGGRIPASAATLDLPDLDG